MKLVLKEFAPQQPIEEGGTPIIGARLDIVFEGKAMISGWIDVSVPHPNPRALSFDEVEQLAIDYVISKM